MIPKETVTLKNFERMERGLPAKAAAKVVRHDPKPPVVPDQIAFKDIPEGEVFELSARSRSVKNKDLMRFTGFDVYVESRDGKIAQGWMAEGEFQKLKQRIQVEAPHLLVKIGL